MSLHNDNQRAFHEEAFEQGARGKVFGTDQVAEYVVRWRLKEAVRRMMAGPGTRLTLDSSILVSCAGVGREGSILCDLGFRNVTVTDITENGVKAALVRDPRLRGEPANAEALPFAEGSYDIAFVQDGLHHLSNPVRGFTELLRVSRHAAFFLEPHDSPAGDLIGTKWEMNGDVTNYVFRWNRRLVEQVTSSYFGNAEFDNRSFSFWHHNPLYARIGGALGGGRLALLTLKSIKATADTVAGRWGNQFCGLIVRGSRA